MNFAFDEDQEALRDSARRLLADQVTSEHVRTVAEADHGFDPDLWTELATEMGWAAIAIPEEYDGLGLGWIEVVALMEEMGRVLLPSPFLSSACLAGTAILEAGTEEQRQRWLPLLAAGELTATLAHAEPSTGWDATTPGLSATPDGDGWRLSGRKRFVLDGHTAGLLLVTARGPDGQIGIAAVDPDQPGIQRERIKTMDRTRANAEIRLEEVRVGNEDILGGHHTDASEALRRTLEHGAAALAAEQVGAAQWCLDTTVEYAKVRKQFGRAIGSFQAVKHKCADMFALVESARSAAWYAGWAATQGGDEASRAAHTAAATATEALWHCAAEAIQIHGGIGFTWEHDAHLYLKRARADVALLGTPAWHRERYLRIPAV